MANPLCLSLVTTPNLNAFAAMVFEQVLQAERLDFAYSARKDDAIGAWKLSLENKGLRIGFLREMKDGRKERIRGARSRRRGERNGLVVILMSIRFIVTTLDFALPICHG